MSEVLTDDEMGRIETAVALGFELGQHIRPLYDAWEAKGEYLYHASSGFTGFWCDLARIAVALDDAYVTKATLDPNAPEWPDVIDAAVAFICRALERKPVLPSPKETVAAVSKLLATAPAASRA